MRPIACCVMLACCELAMGNPTTPQVAAGAASFATAGKTLTVTNAPGTIINWNAFSIAAGEQTRFVQQSAASAVLNRVVGPDPSSILGALSSNGRVFLINPNGIVFGAGAVIDTAGFIASTLNMSDRDFLNGRLRFEGGGNGVLRNEAAIRASGDIVLVGPTIENAGLIRSETGNVVLAAGRSVTITSPDAHGVTFTVRSPDDSAINIGTIEAGNAASLFAATLRHSGDINVTGAQLDGAGRIVLLAQNDATVDAGATVRANGARGGDVLVQSGGATLVAGRIEARGESYAGGTVHLLGERVGLIGESSVDASGARGGGTVLVGGDLRGANPAVQNAAATFIGPDARVRADATLAGDGGNVIVWANDATRVHGGISARGAGGGRGGFVETSGHYLETTRAPEIGAGGTWLLDPINIEVTASTTTNNTGQPNFTPTGDSSQVSAADISSQLNSGTSVVLDTNAAGGTQAGNILVSAAINKTGNNPASLTFNAQNDVTINADILLASGAFNVTTLNTGSTMAVNRTVSIGSGFDATGTVTLNLAGRLAVQSTSATPAELIARNGLSITARSLVVSASSSGGALIANGLETQTITINNAGSGSGIDVVSTGTGNASITHALFSGTCSSACPPSTPGPQTITINDGDRLRVLGAGSGMADITSALDQNIALQGSGLNRIDIGRPTAAGDSRIDAFGNQSISAGSSGQSGAITLSAGVTGATLATIRKLGTSGSQTISTSGTLAITGGSSNSSPPGADARIRHEGAGLQAITANEIVLRGGPSGADNNAHIETGLAPQASPSDLGEQRVVAGAGGITLIGGASGSTNTATIWQESTSNPQTITLNNGGALVLTGGQGTSNTADVVAGAGQTVEVGSGGIQLAGGASGSDNAARLVQMGASADQSISVSGGGAIRLNAGGGSGSSTEILNLGRTQTVTFSAGGTLSITAGYGTSGNRSDLSNGGTGATDQRILFTSGGTINIVGGTNGSSNDGGIVALGGNQTIDGSPDINIAGGGSGGSSSGGNNAFIALESGGGVQRINARHLNLTGGGGTGNSASIDTNFAGTGTGTARTEITAASVTLIGGTATEASAAIGSEAAPLDLTLNASGPVILFGGPVPGAQAAIGSLSSLGGSMTVTTQDSIQLGSNSVLGSPPASGPGVVDVTLRGTGTSSTIVQSPASTIRANRLAASATGLVALDGANQVSSIALASDTAISFNSVLSIEIGPGSFSTPSGDQTVLLTTSGATADIVVSGPVVSDDHYIFDAGRDIVMSGGASLDAATATFAGEGALRFSGSSAAFNAALATFLPVDIGVAAVSFNGPTVASNGLTLSGGTLQGSGDFTTVGGTFVWSGGTLAGTGTLTTHATTTSITAGATVNGRTWNNSGTVDQTANGAVTLLNNAVINNDAHGTWNIGSSVVTAMSGSGTFNNEGALTNTGGSHRFAPGSLTNAGRISVAGGTLEVANFPTNAGTVHTASGTTFSTGNAPLANAGTLAGDGTIDVGTSTLTNSGNVSPGASPGTLTVAGNYVQTSNGTLTVEVAGTQPGTDYDVLNVTGAATLGGTLQIVPVSGYTPPEGQSFTFMTYSSRSGEFNNVSAGFTATPGPTAYGFTPGAATSSTRVIALATPPNEVLALEEQRTTTTTAVQQDAEPQSADRLDKREVARECQ